MRASRNGKIISHSYTEVAKALDGVKGDAVIDGELVALDENGVSHFQLLQSALRHWRRVCSIHKDIAADRGKRRLFTLLAQSINLPLRIRPQSNDSCHGRSFALGRRLPTCWQAGRLP